MAGAGGGAGADRVDAQLLAQLAAELGPLAHQAATSASRLASTSAKSSLEGLRELLHALALERLDDVVVVDARRLERPRARARAVDVAASSVSARPRRGPGTPRSVSRGIVLTVSGPISSST